VFFFDCLVVVWGLMHQTRQFSYVRVREGKAYAQKQREDKDTRHVLPQFFPKETCFVELNANLFV